MNKRHLIAATVAAGILSLGAAGVAVADNASAPASNARCANAATRLQAASDLDHAAGLRLGLLQQALANAQAKGNVTRAGKIQVRISRVTARKQKLEARMQSLEQRCGLPAPT
jgi:hypothetical protein